jgi:hypothetical protein
VIVGILLGIVTATQGFYAIDILPCGSAFRRRPEILPQGGIL